MVSFSMSVSQYLNSVTPRIVRKILNFFGHWNFLADWPSRWILIEWFNYNKFNDC